MPAKFVRSVSLTSELSALIDEKIATGQYRSASEVMRAALRLLIEQDRRGKGQQDQNNINNQNTLDGQESISA